MENECHACGEAIEGKWDSLIELGIETGELAHEAKSRVVFQDKCNKF